VETHQLEYAAPDTQRRSRIVSMPFALSAVVIISTLLAVASITSKFEKIFKDFKVDLPGITKLQLLASRWIFNDYGWLVLLVVAATATICLSLLTSGKLRAPPLTLSARIRCGCIAIACVTLPVVLLFSPLTSILPGLGEIIGCFAWLVVMIAAWPRSQSPAVRQITWLVCSALLFCAAFALVAPLIALLDAISTPGGK